ncbi:MAG: ATP-binding cassette domain-containing protein, partial [Nannocystaceae bacterium]
MIELRGVRKEFTGPTGQPVIAVDELSVSVARGELLCLIGTSGCGKTTTMKMINRLVEPTAGTIVVDGHDIRERDPTALRRGIGYVIQRGGLFPHLSIAANV